MYVAAFNDYAAEIDADAEGDPVVLSGAGVALQHPLLHFDRTAHCINHARELGQEAVAGVLYRPT